MHWLGIAAEWAGAVVAFALLYMWRVFYWNKMLPDYDHDGCLWPDESEQLKDLS